MHVESRAADDLQHVGGRGLLLQRLLRLVDLSCILDRDHRLVGEGLQQLDLLRRELARLFARDDNDADGLAIAH